MASSIVDLVIFSFPMILRPVAYTLMRVFLLSFVAGLFILERLLTCQNEVPKQKSRELEIFDTPNRHFEHQHIIIPNALETSNV